MSSSSGNNSNGRIKGKSDTGCSSGGGPASIQPSGTPSAVASMATAAAAAAAAASNNLTIPLARGDDDPDFGEEGRIEDFLQQTVTDIRESDAKTFRMPAVPLARVKKIMKLDDEVKMISQEAPQFLAKAVELFVNELTNRAWTVTLQSKRTTVQKRDVQVAVTRCEMFDFLIDIVPRTHMKPNKPRQPVSNEERMAQYFSHINATLLKMVQVQAQTQATEAIGDEGEDSSSYLGGKNGSMSSYSGSGSGRMMGQGKGISSSSVHNNATAAAAAAANAELVALMQQQMRPLLQGVKPRGIMNGGGGNGKFSSKSAVGCLVGFGGEKNLPSKKD